MSDTFSAVKAQEEALLCRSYSRYPVAVVRGKGSRLWDVDGKEYVDLLAGIAGRSIPTVHDARRAFSSWAWDSPHGTVELRAGEARHPVHLAVADGVDLEVVAQVSTGGR